MISVGAWPEKSSSNLPARYKSGSEPMSAARNFGLRSRAATEKIRRVRDTCAVSDIDE